MAADYDRAGLFGYGGHAMAGGLDLGVFMRQT
jgi:hypothetical protein